MVDIRFMSLSDVRTGVHVKYVPILNVDGFIWGSR